MDPVARIGEPLPAFRLPDLDGQEYTPAQAGGKILILNFWSAECPWAKRADQILLPWLAGWGDAVLLWAVASNANEAPQDLRRAARERGVEVVLLDRGAKVADLLGAETTPHFFVADGEGVLRYKGALDDTTFRQRQPTRHFLKEAVEALLVGKLPEISSAPPYGCTIVRHAVP
jgi:hypothetical protein